MKKKTIKKTTIRRESRKSKCWIWIAFAFVIGCACGYVGHYLVINWNGFWAVCPDGNKPDKNGCCGGEIYTDAGDGWMVCCPDGGDNCFPPIK